jgi:cyclopropane fatty-acyl-phospholipid synthase-like methyltransferase
MKPAGKSAPQPKADQWEEIFKRDGHIFAEPAQIVMDFAVLLQKRGCKTVLDLGCGTGRHAVYLARQRFSLIGLDNSPTGLRMARQWLDEEKLSTSLLLADSRFALPFRDKVFDAILSTQVIHHALLETVHGTAREITRILKKGGLMLITIPASKDRARHSEIEPNTFIPMAGDEKGLPHHIFTPDGLCSIFPAFKVLDLRTITDHIIALTAVKT